MLITRDDVVLVPLKAQIKCKIITILCGDRKCSVLLLLDLYRYMRSFLLIATISSLPSSLIQRLIRGFEAQAVSWAALTNVQEDERQRRMIVDRLSEVIFSH